MTQLLAAAGALHLLPTWLALQEEGWRQRRRRGNTVGTIDPRVVPGEDEQPGGFFSGR